MNTHDKDELPTLPSTWYNESTKDTMREYTHGTIEHFLNQSGQYVTNDASRQAAINAAIEPYAKRIAELEAARIAYASEFAPNEDGEPDVGRIHENIRKLKADRQRRGEPVARYRIWNKHIEKWVYGASEAGRKWAIGQGYVVENLPAEPVKVPSDEEIQDVALRCFEAEVIDIEHEIRALLARYGQPAQPTGKSPLQVAAQPSVPAGVMRWNPLPGGGMNPHPTGLYVRYEDIAPTSPSVERAQQDADNADALLQLIDEFRERLPSSFLTLVDAARAGKEE